MTSILTNTSAMAALQTLRKVNAGLDRTQQQISSGLRVQTASDNAAYWSIATTMRSDSKAVSAVTDALGLGAAKVDTASAGLTATVDVLAQFKAKLVAATEKGVDRSKIQDELDQLKDQLLSTAGSASFNGVNWLNTNEPKNLVEVSSLDASVTSSFTRSSDGSVSVGQTKLDITAISLFNAGGGGVLQKDIRSLSNIGGLRDADLATNSSPGRQAWKMTGPVTLTGSNTISFDLSIDGGGASTMTIDKATVDAALGTTDGIIGDSRKYALVLNQAFANAGISSLASAGSSNQTVSIETKEQTGNDASSIVVSNVQQLPAGNAGGLAATPILDQPGEYASGQFTFTAPFRVYRDVGFSFDVGVGGNASQSIKVDRALVDNVLGTSDGWINSASDLATVLGTAASGKGVNVSASGGDVVFDVDSAVSPQMGARSSLVVGNVTDNLGPAPDFDIMDVDITNPAHDVDDYLKGVDIMLQKAIAGASVLGSVKTRIDLQAGFAQNLMDSMDKGIGRLADADMEEASAKLTAQQTQRQLAVQSLQIANSSAQSIMQLFQKR